MRSNDEIITILTELKNKKKISLSELAREVGMAKSALSRYFNRTREFPLNKVEDFACALHTTSEYILGFEEDKPKPPPLPIASIEMVDLPLYGDVAAGALAEMESVDVWDVENIQLPKVILPALNSYAKLFAMRVNGDSMDKVIPDHSLVVVKPCEDHLYKDGDIVVFSYNGEYSLKRYRPNVMKGFILFEADSNNPDFQDIPINKDDMPEARIYGKVIFYGVTPTN